MISSNLSAGYSPSDQFISFVEGSSSEAPDPANYSLTVLGSGDDLNVLDGGDPTGGFAPWVNDILVYPSSEYWETLLHEGRVRPYLDLSISNYNTVRVPSAIHNYDLYVDKAVVYEDITIHGSIITTGGFSVSSIASDNFSIAINGDAELGDINAGVISGVANTRTPILTVTEDITLTNDQTGTIINSKPTGSNINISLPTSGLDGVTFSILHCGSGSTTTFIGTLLARGNALAEQYSACTIYWGGDGWYAFGDLL